MPSSLNKPFRSVLALNGYGGCILKVFFIYSLFFSFTANAQYEITKPAISGKRYPPSVLQVAEDSRGFIWYLTHDGLYRYDGQRSVYLKKELVNLGFKGTPDNMLMDSHNRLWLAGKECAGFLDIKSWRLTKAPVNLLKRDEADD